MSVERKIAVLCRVEPGCLGPDGRDHIEAFCALAQRAMQHFDVDVGTWILTPRYDKTLEEMQYSVADKLTSLINLYLARK